MPRWQCPYCETESNVPTLIVGHVEACPNCTRPSMVIDIDGEQIAKLRRETAIGTATAASLPNMWVIKAVLVLGALCPALLALTFFATGNPFAILYGGLLLGSIAVSMAVISVFLEAMNDIHRCRRLLEELVRKRD